MRLMARTGALMMVTATLCATPAVASDFSYDEQLMRLAEIMGSVHFLHGLCNKDEGPWRSQMEALLEAEDPSEERRTQLIANFNHGYRAFSTTYTRCTESAEQAIEHYMKEGEALTREIVMRFGE